MSNRLCRTQYHSLSSPPEQLQSDLSLDGSEGPVDISAPVTDDGETPFRAWNSSWKITGSDCDRIEGPESTAPSRETQQSYSSTGAHQDRSTEYTKYSDSKPGPEHAQAHDLQQVKLGLYEISTEYSASERSKAPAPHAKQYIADLATDLYDSIKSCNAEKETLRRISDILPNLLRAFAIKVGHNACGQTARDVSYFVHKYRRQVQSEFEDLSSLKDDGVQNGEYSLVRYKEEPDFAFGDVDLAPEYPDSEPDIPEIMDDVNDSATDSDEHKNEELYRDFIVGTPEYEWLVKTFQRETVSRRASPDILESVGAEILAALPSTHRVSRRKPPQRYEVTFELHWDPISFVEQQSYSGVLDLGRAITITGSASDAQALTATEYLAQTWPTGDKIMQLIKDVATHGPDHSVTCTLLDRTELRAQIHDKRFFVIATGPGDSVKEVGQQIAWIGAALRSSPFATGITTCTPFVSSTSLKAATTSELESIARLTCVLDFDIQPPAVDAAEKTGQCWHDMFRNPVMVIGFPIPLKVENKSLGLEMPLNIISALAGSSQVHEFDGKVFIKGFSTMVVATKKMGELVMWHYFYNADRSKLSHLDHTLGKGLNGTIGLSQLENSRHVVGWCSDCRVYAGSKDAYKDVKTAKSLPPTSSGCRLEKFTLSGGKFVTAGATFSIGTKDKPTHLTMKGYIEKLRSIDEKYVVVWDELDKMGWLVTGTSALLHLVRVALHHRSKDKFAKAFRWKQSNMNEFDSPVDVLIDQGNRELITYADKPTISEEDERKREGSDDIKQSTAKKAKWEYSTFQDLVEQIYLFLDQVIDYESQAQRSDGVKLKADFRRHLEGWDFVEIAHATTTEILPRVAKLDALGWGWLDFIRSIGAVTLFGQGFGEMIKPEPFEGMCPNWWSLPKAKYSLAVSGSDLENVNFDLGKLAWHSPAAKPIETCRCQGTSGFLLTPGVSHHDPVQVFCPKISRHIKSINTPNINANGAYIFGHNFNWRYRWRSGKHKDGEDLEEIPVSSTSSERVPGISIETCPESSTSELASFDVTPSAQSENSSTTDATRHPSISSAAFTAPTSVNAVHHLPHHYKRTLPQGSSIDTQTDQRLEAPSSESEPTYGQERRAKRRKQREADISLG